MTALALLALLACRGDLKTTFQSTLVADDQTSDGASARPAGSDIDARPDESAASRLVDGRFDHALNAAAGGFISPADQRLTQWPLTAELWVRLAPGGGERVLLSSGLSGSAGQWELSAQRQTGRLVLRLPTCEPSVVDTGLRLDAAEWRHVAIVLEADRARAYVDARLVAEEKLVNRPRPPQPAGLGIGTRLEEKRPSAVLIDDVRISAGVREILAVPQQPHVTDQSTIGLWSFDESEADYLARWTPGGETNQRGLPYPQRIAEYEFETDADWVDGRWQDTDKGPFITHSTLLPGHEVGPKNLTVFLRRRLARQSVADSQGEATPAAVLYDLERCAVVAGVLDAKYEIDPLRFGLLRKPVLRGCVLFSASPVKAWRRPAAGGTPGPTLERHEIDHRGLYRQGRDVLLEANVAGGAVLTTSRVESIGPATAVVRQLEAAGCRDDLLHTLAELPAAARLEAVDNTSIAFCEVDGIASAVLLMNATPPMRLAIHGRDVLLPIGKQQPCQARWLHWRGPAAQLATIRKLARARAGSLTQMKRPGPRLWGEPLVTQGVLADVTGHAPYVIDTITVPCDNPHGALFYITGFDFFEDGTAALCTAHGDVWLVRGLDEKLQRVTWQRFATGLYQPLGLVIVAGQAIVLGRDQLTRLHDTNGDGEADFYESFNNDLVIQGQDHAFAMRLETDRAGNFYFLKSGGGPHGSALLKVARDGSRLDVLARGFRHPYGLGVSLTGDVTVADNEGNWVPSSKIDLIQPGGFYGYLGNQSAAPPGVTPARPLCYIPKVADNSCGGQLWNTSRQWGDYHTGGMLHLSWGRCTLHAVLEEEAGGARQAATVRFPGLMFLSGPGEAAFHPLDGQLYVIGLDGWQTAAVKDGGFQRVRYTGRPIDMPSGFHVHQNGVRVAFTQPLDPGTAGQIDNYRIEQWNYRWSATYGSFHYSASDPDRIGHDTLKVASAELLPDGKSVFLAIPGLAPVDQLHVHTDLTTLEGRPLRFDLYGTVNALGRPW